MSPNDSAPGQARGESLETASPPGTLRSELSVATPDQPSWWRVHAWPFAVMVALLLIGMAFSLFWNDVIHHVNVWHTPPDLWATFRDAHYIIWDGEGQVYNA